MTDAEECFAACNDQKCVRAGHCMGLAARAADPLPPRHPSQRQVEAALQAWYSPMNHSLQERMVAALAAASTFTVSVGQMGESNGRVTHIVFLRRSASDNIFDSYQIYADEIEGRAQYEAARLRYFLGQGPKPDILLFDTDPKSSAPAVPSEEAKCAARYRWLREDSGHGPTEKRKGEIVEVFHGKVMDEMIDAAMKATL